MKNLLVFSTVVLAIVISGCGGDGSGGSPPTPSNNQMLSEFTVTIDGIVNKVEVVGFDLDALIYAGQNCNAGFSGGIGTINLGITDITSPFYVSGYPFKMYISFEANLLGEVDAQITLTPVSSFYYDKYPSYLGAVGSYILTSDSAIGSQDYLVGCVQWSVNKSILGTKINITDFGTKYNLSAPSSSKPFKGHMNKTRLYFPKKVIGGNYENWGFMDLEMSFELYRTL